MKKKNKDYYFSPTDLSHHLSCEHLTSLSIAEIANAVKRPIRDNPALDLLIERGNHHEEKYLEYLKSQGLAVVQIERDPQLAVQQTHQAMLEGADVIAQAALRLEPWFGYADVLRKVPIPSKLGDYSYEVIDTKLTQDHQSRHHPATLHLHGAGRRPTRSYARTHVRGIAQQHG